MNDFISKVLKREEGMYNGLDLEEKTIILLYYDLRDIKINRGKESYEYKKTFQKLISDLKQFCSSRSILEEPKVENLHKLNIGILSLLVEYIHKKDKKSLDHFNQMTM